MLSPMFNPQEFFVPKELLPPKKQTLYTPTSPQIFEIGKSSIKIHLKYHEKQIDDILNYLEELSFHRIEKMEEGQFPILNKSLRKSKLITKQIRRIFRIMLPKRTSTFETPAITLDAIWQLILDLTTTVEAQTAAIASASNPNNLTRNELNQYSLEADQANRTTWTELKRLLTNKYCPRTEEELYNLSVKRNDLKPYVRRFQELTTLCSNMVPNNEKLLEAFIGGLPQSIEGIVTASKPQTLEEAINIS
ncbi:reverse transcriptase domain-containing protein [Tanacetum coccineum]